MNAKPTSKKPSLVQKVADYIDTTGLLYPCASVVLGVSGGSDSVAMLVILRELSLQEDRAYKLTVAHLDHGLRKGSQDEARFVAQMAEFLSLPFVVRRENIAHLARQTLKSVEQTGRDARYDFFLQVAYDSSASFVALAHHADDNVETILYRLVRGTHLRGLAGIPPRRQLGKGVQIIRPLMPFTRKQIDEFCRARKLPYREDFTNSDTRYRRNFIRHRVLPMLRQINPRADEALVRLAGSAGQVEEFMSQSAEQTIETAIHINAGQTAIDRQILKMLHPALLTYAVRIILERAGVGMGAISQDHLDRINLLILLENPPAVTLPGGFEVRCRGLEVVVEKSSAIPPQVNIEPVSLKIPGLTQLEGGMAVRCELLSGKDIITPDSLKADKPAGVEMLDADKISGPLTARTRRNGDSLIPLGGTGHVSVSDFLTNAKIPQTQRDKVVVIADDQGIVYLAPLRIADRVKLTAKTRRILRISLVQRS